MRQRVLLATGFVLVGLPAIASAPKPLQKVLVWVVGKHNEFAQQLELQYQTELAQRQIDSSSFRALFPSSEGQTAAGVIKEITKQNFDSVLTFRRGTAITWSNPQTEKERTARLGSLEGFIKAYFAPGGKLANIDPNTPFDIDDIVSEQPASPEPGSGAPAPIGRPIPGSVQPGWQIMKVEILLFSLPSGKPKWSRKIDVRTPIDLRTTLFQKEIVDQTLTRISKAGYIPEKSKKLGIF
jgi:hypothetical protein